MDRFFEKHNLVWHSTPASIEAGKTSFLAALETLICVGIWWWAYFAGWFTWWTIGLGLISSLIVLLRCDESVEDGLKRFINLRIKYNEVINYTKNSTLNTLIDIFKTLIKQILFLLIIFFIRITSSMFFLKNQ